MLTSRVVLLLSVVFESSIADLPPPININQLDYAVGRKAEVAGMRDDDEPMECGTKKWLDCTDWENNYVLLETPGYPAMYQNKDKCIWKIQIPKESGTWIYCEEFSLNEGDYLYVGNQRYFGHKNYASIEPFQKSKQHTLRLKFKSNWRERNNGFKCWVTCWPTDPSQTPSYETTTTTTTTGEIMDSSAGLPAGRLTPVKPHHTKLLQLLLQQEMTSGPVQALNLQLLKITSMENNVFRQVHLVGRTMI